MFSKYRQVPTVLQQIVQITSFVRQDAPKVQKIFTLNSDKTMKSSSEEAERAIKVKISANSDQIFCHNSISVTSLFLSSRRS